jgi:hypothetical protein
MKAEIEKLQNGDITVKIKFESDQERDVMSGATMRLDLKNISMPATIGKKEDDWPECHPARCPSIRTFYEPIDNEFHSPNVVQCQRPKFHAGNHACSDSNEDLLLTKDGERKVVVRQQITWDGNPLDEEFNEEIATWIYLNKARAFNTAPIRFVMDDFKDDNKYKTPTVEALMHYISRAIESGKYDGKTVKNTGIFKDEEEDILDSCEGLIEYLKARYGEPRPAAPGTINMKE